MKRLALLMIFVESTVQALPRGGALPGPAGGGSGSTAAVSNLTFVPVRPTALAASQNDYSPGAGNLFYITASTPVNITGLVAGADGFQECFANVGSNAITFTHRDSASAAANRLNNGLGDASGNVVVAGNEAVCYSYDLTNTRWQMLWTSSPSGYFTTGANALTGGITMNNVATDFTTSGADKDLTFAPIAGGEHFFIAGAGSTVAEPIADYYVDDDITSGVAIWNQRTTNAQTIPAIWGYTAATNNGNAGLNILGSVTAASDTGTTGVVIISASRGTGRRVASAAITTRPPIVFSNFGTTMADFTPAGTFRPLTYGGQTNCADSAGAAACGAAPSGSFVLDAAATTVVVSTTAVTANSQIFIQEDRSLTTRLSIGSCTPANAGLYFVVVTARSAATSFTIGTFASATGSALAPTTNPACFNYFIVN